MKELSTISLRRNYLPISYDKIPVFYTLKYHKFTTVTFYPSALHPNPLLASPNFTISSLPHAIFNYISFHVTVTLKYRAKT